MIKQVYTFIIFLFLLAKIQIVTAEIDAMELALLKPYQNNQIRRWDNISKTFFLNVEELVYFPQWNLRGIRTHRGKLNSFYLPAYESLRLYNPDHRLLAEDFKIYLSNGSGLLATTVIQTTIDGHSLIISPRSSKPVIVNVGNNKQNKEIELAVFVSRQVPVNKIAPYPDLKWLSGQWVWMGKKPFQIPEIYWRMQPGKQQIVELEGPARILLKNRLQYEATASELFQDYRIRYRLDDNAAEWFDFTTGVESKRTIFINSQQVVVGQEQQAYIEIPAGQHRLQLMSDRTLYLRVLQQTEKDYLLPQLNQPSLSVKTVREQALMAKQKLPEIKLLAQNLARDNRHKTSAMIAQQLLEQGVFTRMDYPDGFTEADKIRRQNTFYRNLLPRVKNSRKDQFKAYFVNKKLRAFRDPEQDVVVAKQHISASLKRLGSAYFNPLSATPDSYLLPERYAASSLRIIVDKRDCEARAFKIQMDKLPPQRLLIRCQDIVKPEDAFAQKSAEKVLLDLQKQFKVAENTTLSHQFAAYRKPAMMISEVAVNEINLPAQIRQLKIWRVDKQQKPLNLALQIRAAKPYQFSEQSYLARLQELPQSRLFKRFIKNLEKQDRQKNTSQTEQQLENEWIPLQRFITGLSRHYRSAVADKIPLRYVAKPSQLEKWKKQALQAEKKQQWIEALTHWSRISESSQNEIRDKAQFAQAIILKNLSENYLAQRLLRYLSLYAQPEIATKAQTQLLKIYQIEDDVAAMQMLAAAMLVQHPDRERVNILLQALMQNNQYHFVLLLGLILDDPPVELMLKAAYQLNWWHSYQQLLSQLPEIRQKFWVALKAQKQGDYETALKIWEKTETTCWSQHLQQGLEIREQLNENRDVEAIYKRWSKWQENNCAKTRIWEDASRLVKDAAGTDQYYALERDLYMSAFRGTKERPVTLRVLGPATLNFKVRMLHEKMESELDTWLKITDNQKNYRSPVNKNKAVQGLVLIGETDYLPGNSVSVKYLVGEGVHEIQLSSDDAPISVKIDEQRPELPNTVLAPLQLDTFTQANLADEEKIINSIADKPSSSTTIVKADLNLKTLQSLPPVVNAVQAETRITQYLALLEQEKKGRAWLLSSAEQLMLRFPEQKTVRTLWNRISRYSRWQKVSSIVSSAGIRFVDTQGWQPVSSALLVRKALISRTKEDEHVVFSDQRLLLMMTNLKARTLHVDALLDDLLFLPGKSAQLLIQINETEPQSFVLDTLNARKKIKLQVEEGVHLIRFWIAKPIANQFLKLRFQEDVTDLDLKVNKERSFFVSTKTQPLKIQVKGPAMIRVDEWLDGKIVPHYQTVSSGWQWLSIPPSDGQGESLLQVRQRVISDEQPSTSSRIILRKLNPVAAPDIQLEDIERPETVVIEDFYKLGKQQDGTWSIGTDSVRRNNVQEDTEQGNPEHFQQFSLNHRYFDETRNVFWNTEGFIRAREHGGPTLGFKESVYIKPDDYSFNLNLEAKVVSQIVHKDFEWLGQFKIAISQLAYITPKLSILPKLSWYGRYMSAVDNDKLEDNSPTEDIIYKEKLDQDVFTNYKSQHPVGLSSSLLFNYDPWLDTRWTVKIKTVSNENMNLFRPDYFSSEVHWKQLLGEVFVDAGYRISFFQKDNDRDTPITRQITKLELGWEAWTENKNRFEINATYNYDIERKAHLGLLSFSYHFGEGRGYRDFKPGEIDFRQIRTRQGLNEDY